MIDLQLEELLKKYSKDQNNKDKYKLTPEELENSQGYGQNIQFK